MPSLRSAKLLPPSFFSLGASVASAALDGAQIETLTGLKGTMDEAEAVFKITSPRTDVKIAVDGWTMPPFMGLTTWAAFKPGVKAVVMPCGGPSVPVRQCERVTNADGRVTRRCAVVGQVLRTGRPRRSLQDRFPDRRRGGVVCRRTP